MSEHIDHEAAKLIAKQAIKIYGMAGGHLNVGLQRISLAYLDLDAQLAAERARVEALVDVIHDANGIAYPFAEMQDKMTAILNAHAQGNKP